MKTSILSKLSYLVLVIVAVFMLYVGVQLFSPFNPATVEVPIKVQNENVKKGEPIVLLLTSCTHIETKVQLRVELLLGQGEISLPLFTLNDVPTKKGCLTEQPFPIQLEDANVKLPSGTYKIRLRTIYVVNSIRTETINYDSEQFNYKGE